MVLTLSVFQHQSDLIEIQTITSAIGVILIIKEIAIGLSAGLILTIWFSYFTNIINNIIAKFLIQNFFGTMFTNTGSGNDQTQYLYRSKNRHRASSFCHIDGTMEEVSPQHLHNKS